MSDSPEKSGASPHPKEWTSDEIWELVKARVTEHWRVFRWFTILIGSLLSAVIALAVAILASNDIRDVLVRTWIVDVDAKFNKYIKDNATNLTVLDSQIDSYMGRVVAYSYSTDFELAGSSAGKKYHNLAFYKTDGDKGRLMCHAIYPNTRVKNKIFLTFNNKKAPQFELAPDKFSLINIVSDTFEIPPENKDLFVSAPSPHHKIAFTLDRATSFEGAISIGCTILIIGPARLQ